MATGIQGREFTTTLQGPSKSALNEMIGSARKFAREHQMENFKILERGRDPDGGYRAIVTAHNWNPITWLKEKIKGKRAGGEEGDEEYKAAVMTQKQVTEAQEEVASGSRKEATRDQKEWKKTAGETAEEKMRREDKENRKRQEQYARDEKDRLDEEAEATVRMEKERFLGRFPPSQRKRAEKLYDKRYESAATAKTEAVFEVWSQSVPEKFTTYQKVLQKEYWTRKGTTEAVPEPKTAEERAQAEYHPSQWGFIPQERDLTVPERLSVARSLQMDAMEMDIAKDKYKQFKRERSLPYRAAKAAGGFGTFMAGAVMMGVAGAARSARPGSAGPARAARMHAPGLPLDVYAVRPMLGVGVPSSRSLTGAGLGHLRELTMPGIRRARTEVRRTSTVPGRRYREQE